MLNFLFIFAQVSSSGAGKPKSRNGVAANNASLHSSNDSGFANEPAPPQPDIDYSDDETVAARVPIRYAISSKSIPLSYRPIC